MKVILLAAGRSKRLKPIIDKNFLEFLGKPLIEHQLDILAAAGFDDFIVVGGEHNLERIELMASRLEYKIEIAEQEDLGQGQAGGVLAASKFVKNESVLIVSANDVVDIEAFKLVLKASKDNDFESFIVGKEVDSYFPGGYLSTDDNNTITGIVEKPGEGNEPGNLVNIVIHYHKNSKKLFDALKNAQSDNDDVYEVALDDLIRKGTRMKALPYSGFWQPIKYPWHVLSVMDHFLGLLKGPFTRGVQVAKSATLRGNVYLAEGVRVMDNAVIHGPAYIGENTVVASGALVRNSNVGKDCVVGFASEVARSFLGNEVWTHTNYIGDSVIGNNVSFGAGSVTGNLRFDEADILVGVNGEKISCERNKFGLITGDNVRSGINTSFMPGVKIGNNVCVGAGTVIEKDIDDNKFVTGVHQLKEYENKLNITEVNRGEMKDKIGK
jgi:NDP-sugar pyrophosphorylase family protein